MAKSNFNANSFLKEIHFGTRLGGIIKDRRL